MNIKNTFLLAFLLWMLPHVAKAICYVNTESTDVRLVYNSKTGEKEYRTIWGDFLCTEKESKPLKDMDKFYIYENKWVEQGSQFAPKKEWDSWRGCYVWKSVDGDFLGRDISSITDEDLQWLSEQDLDWWDEVTLPPDKRDLIADLTWQMQERLAEAQAKKDAEALRKLKEEEEKKLAEAKRKQQAQTESTLRQTDAQMQMTDAQIKAARQQIEQARRQLRAAGMTEYMGDLDRAEAALNQAEATSRQYKQQRNK